MGISCGGVKMKIQESGEMYLEAILVLKGENPQVRAIDVAGYTGYSKPSISRALGILKKGGFINVDKDGFISFTELGQKRAETIYERHNILSAFFRKIGVSDETAVEDACKIEHVISDETFSALKKYAGLE